MNRTARPRHWPLRSQGPLVACLLVLGVSLAVGEGVARHQAQRAFDENGHTLAETARTMADRLSKEMADRTREVETLSRLDLLRGEPTPEAGRKAFESVRASLPVFAWIGMTDTAGTVIAATDDILVGQSIAERPVFRHGIKGPWTGDVHEAVLLASFVPHPPGEPVKVVDVAAPVLGPDGQLRGMLAMHLSWQWADQLRQTVLRPRGAARSQTLAIFSARGEVLLPSERSAPDTALPAPRIDALTDRWGVETWTDGAAAVTAVAESKPVEGFEGFGWRVVVRDTAAASGAMLREARQRVLPWALGAGLVLAAALGWGVARRRLPTDAQPPLRDTGDFPASRPGAVHPSRRSDGPQAPAGVVRLHSAARERDDPPRPPSGDLAGRDPLTGLWNGAHLATVCAGLDTPPPVNGPVQAHGILSIDLDGFKAVNDRYGQPTGDDVLAQVGRRLRQAARANDLVFRLGGDEFLILLPCEPGEALAVGRAVAQRLLAELQRPMSYRTLSNLKVRASVGGAVWPLHGATLAQAIACAGEALLAAKQSGRGQFRQYALPTADPSRLTA